jgi:hypothetical protein
MALHSVNKDFQARSLLGLGGWALSALLAMPSAGIGQSSIGSQVPPSGSRPPLTSSAEEHSTSTTSAPGEATIVVYRVKSFVGSALVPSIFINGDFLAKLQNPNYAVIKVPAGTVTVEAPSGKEAPWLRSDGNLVPFQYGVREDPSLQACAGVSFSRMRDDLYRKWLRGDHSPVKQEDIAVCKESLRQAVAMTSADAWNLKIKAPSQAVIDLCGLKPSPAMSYGYGSNQVSQTAGYDRAEVNRCWDGLRADLVLLNSTSVEGGPPTQVTVSAEAGKTYYVRWSFSPPKVVLKLVDEATGERDSRNLRPVDAR